MPKSGGAFTDAWESSPYSDAYLAALAATAIDGMKLGRGAGTDFLGISFSSLDKVGHDFGSESHEVQDVLIRLDAEMGTLLDKLDREVGKGNYVVALTSDHGVAPVPERLIAQGYDAGRINAGAVGRAIDAVLAAELGPASYRTRVIYNDIYFNEGVYLKLTQNAESHGRGARGDPQDAGRLACLPEGRTIGHRSPDAPVGAQPLRGPQRRHQDAGARLLDYLVQHEHARHRASLRHARAGVVVRPRHQEG